MRIKNVHLEIIQGDLTSAVVDAVVCPARPSLVMDQGLAAVVKVKAGEAVESEARHQAPLRPGEAVATAAGALPARWVVHAVTVDEGNQTDEHVLRRAVSGALLCAEAAGARSLAMPALGCGVGTFPAVGAAKIMAQEILKFARHEARSVERVGICLDSDEMWRIFSKHVEGYLRHIEETLGQGPYVTVDILIERPDGLVVIERMNPPYGLALPGGFVDYGESLEHAARREAKEETDLDLADLRQWRAFSDPGRDPRFHTVSTVFIARGEGQPRAGDDAQALRVVPYAALLDEEYAFDHKEIIRFYLGHKRGG